MGVLRKGVAGGPGGGGGWRLETSPKTAKKCGAFLQILFLS
jgi:hypothetical protein